MSHLSERKEKDYLNCGTIVIGKYCHTCGQDNKGPKDTVWQLVCHFFSDITHFDGKFFTSVKDLILKSGFLSGEFMRGKKGRLPESCKDVSFYFLCFFPGICFIV